VSDQLIISVGIKRATIFGKFPKDDVDEALSAYVKGFQYSPLFRQRKKDGSRVWDGKMRLFSRVTNSFPVGVLDIVCDLLDKRNIAYELKRPYLEELNLSEKMRTCWISGGWKIQDQFGPFKLYDYQKKAIRTFFDPTRPLPYRGVIKIATGGGKTACGAAIAKIINSPTLFLVHGKKLTRQNLDVFKKVFDGEEDKIGIIDSNNWTPSLVTIASSDTLFSRMKNLDYEDKLIEFFDGLILTIADECHRATSKSFADILKAVNAPMRLGLSGTPNKKEDDRDLLLHSLTGDIIFEMGVSELKKKGTISKAHLLCVIVKEPTGFEELDWQDAFTSLVINNGFRHEIIAKLISDRVKEGRTILVLAGNSLDLASNIYNRTKPHLPDGQIRLVNGLSQDKYVDESFKMLQDKELSCVVTTTIADEGIDIPAVNSLVLAGGGKSFVRTVQRVGRSLRLKADGSDAEIIDLLDTTNPYLKKHSKARLDYYNEEKLFDTAKSILARDV
jgi:superfamily II DNA or RNA helicase